MAKLKELFVKECVSEYAVGTINITQLTEALNKCNCHVG